MWEKDENGEAQNSFRPAKNKQMLKAVYIFSSDFI